MSDWIVALLFLCWVFSYQITIPYKVDGTWHEITFFAKKDKP